MKVLTPKLAHIALTSLGCAHGNRDVLAVCEDVRRIVTFGCESRGGETGAYKVEVQPVDYLDGNPTDLEITILDTTGIVARRSSTRLTDQAHARPLRKAILEDRELARTGLTEECSEVIKEVCKASRFGLDTPNPIDGTTPAGRLSTEIGDLLGSVDFVLKTHPELDREAINAARSSREERLRFHNNPDNWGKPL